jgi:hypothetical protein
MIHWDARTRPMGTFRVDLEILEFLPEGPGTGFLHKKRVPGGLLSAPSDFFAKDPGGLFWLRAQAAFCTDFFPGGPLLAAVMQMVSPVIQKVAGVLLIVLGHSSFSHSIKHVA